MTNETVTTETVTGETDLDRARAAFQRELLVEGLLVETEVPGLYGRSGVFEDIVDGIDRVVIAAGPGDAATRLRFPPVFPRSSFERTDYIASFPNLTGAINTFAGSNRDHARLLADRAEGQSWDRHLEPTETMLVSAACHSCLCAVYRSSPRRRSAAGHLRFLLPARTGDRSGSHAGVSDARVRDDR